MKVKSRNAILNLIILTVQLVVLALLFLMFVNSKVFSLADFSLHNLIVIFAFILVIIGTFLLYTKNLNAAPALEYEEEATTSDELDERTGKAAAEDKEQEEVLEELDAEKIAGQLIPETKDFKELNKYAEKLLSNFSNHFDFVQGVFFIHNTKENQFEYCADYAYIAENRPEAFKEGDTLSGQVAKNKKMVYISDIPDNYIKVVSGLGESSPNHLVIAPVIVKNKVIGVIEFASFKDYKENEIHLIEKLAEKTGIKINTYLKE